MSWAPFTGDNNWLGRIVKTGYTVAGKKLVKGKNDQYYKVDGDPFDEPPITKRQIQGCNTYGLDFQDGGNYFVNTNSNDSFTFVSSFVGCQNDTASVMLINQNTGDQYDCGSVPTVPDNAPEIATCPVLKDQIASGDFLIIAVGNNGNGTPFAYQREFNISAGPQQTTTYYYTPTVTSTPIVITTSTSVANYTSTVPNTLSTVTALSPVYTQTITPPRSAVTQVSTSTQTFTRWSQVDASTATVVTATCRTPLRPLHPDPICTVFPNKLQIPVGVTGVQRRPVPFGETGPTPAPALHKRAPDATAITVTSPANTTVTLTAGFSSTETNIEALTSTYFVMDTAPQTVFVGQPVQTVTAAVAPVETRVQTSFARAYETQTFGLTWTQTLTSTPSAALESCRAVGGHFGRWW